MKLYLGLTNMKSVDNLSVWIARVLEHWCESPDRIEDLPHFFANMWWIDYSPMDYCSHPIDPMTECWYHWMPYRLDRTKVNGFLAGGTSHLSFDANDRILDHVQQLCCQTLPHLALHILHLDHGFRQLNADNTQQIHHLTVEANENWKRKLRRCVKNEK